MFRQRRRILATMITMLTLLVSAGTLRAEGQDPAPQNYQGAQYVWTSLGSPNVEQGIRLVDDQPDGLTQALTDEVGRQSVPNGIGTERYFYFDIHDTYVHGGKNQVFLSVTYKDRGLTPIYLEYDAFDPVRPRATVPEVSRKRIDLVRRTNSEELRTVRITLDDARLLGAQPGGADFRIGSADDLVLTSVSVRVLKHEQPLAAPRIVIDGREVAFDDNDVLPYIHPTTGRTLVPFRKVFNALGIADTDIIWHNDTRSIEAKKGNTVIKLTIDSDVATVNYLPTKLEQPAIIMAGRTLVPLRWVADQFGMDIGWDGVNRIVTLTARPQPAPQPPVSKP